VIARKLSVACRGSCLAGSGTSTKPNGHECGRRCSAAAAVYGGRAQIEAATC
jgi:hypothetical protein